LQNKNIKDMKTLNIKMTEREYKRYQSYKEAEKIIRSIKRSFKEISEAKSGKRKLKSAKSLIDEI